LVKLFVKKKYLLSFLILAVLAAGCNSQSTKVLNGNSASDTRSQHWVEDIDYLYENLPKAHKNLYHTIKEEDFKKEILDLKNDVPKLKDYEIKCRLAQIVASVGDAHTSLYLFSNSATYPMKLSWFNEELRILAADKEHKDILGKKLVAVNDMPIKEIMKKVNSLISHENEQWLRVVNADYVMMPDVLKLLGITSEDRAQFSLEDEANNISKIELSSKKFTSENVVMVKDEMPVKPLRFQYNPNNLSESLYWYKYLPEEKILYFQYNECIDRSIAKSFGVKNLDEYPYFGDFSDGLLKAINDNDIDKFIVDLRNNRGGASTLMTTLAKDLSNIDKLKGKVYVMIGRQTFSSGVMAALDLMDKTNAVFYGEPTGGNVNGYGDIKNLVLPNSKLEISYSTKYFEMSDKFTEGFIPDVTVIQKFDDYKQGIDDVYEAIKNKKN